MQEQDWKREVWSISQKTTEKGDEGWLKNSHW